jgi:hypothetical protein
LLRPDLQTEQPAERAIEDEINGAPEQGPTVLHRAAEQLSSHEGLLTPEQSAEIISALEIPQTRPEQADGAAARVSLPRARMRSGRTSD